MIFVTVGTHEQPFNRLVKAVDDLKRDRKIADEVFIQTGFSTYEPQFCQWEKMLSFDEMQKKTDQARIVITHGGPASFMMPLQMGKVPVVVPRQAEFGEHINDHQVEFVRHISSRTGMIVPVYKIAALESSILRAGAESRVKPQSHNRAFNEAMKQIILDLMNQ